MLRLILGLAAAHKLLPLWDLERVQSFNRKWAVKNREIVWNRGSDLAESNIDMTGRRPAARLLGHILAHSALILPGPPATYTSPQPTIWFHPRFHQARDVSRCCMTLAFFSRWRCRRTMSSGLRFRGGAPSACVPLHGPNADRAPL